MDSMRSNWDRKTKKMACQNLRSFNDTLRFKKRVDPPHLNFNKKAWIIRKQGLGQ